jgi:vacuolar-type H+-ATPase subunit H
MEARVEPILTRVQYLIEDAQPRISSAIADAAEITHLARSQAQKVDRVFTETLDRARMQLAHADQILTGALEAVEDAGSQIRRTVVGPINSASAVIRGIQTGLEFFRSRRRRPHSEGPGASPDHPDENLFI